jgi:hypothetical protein
MATGPHAIRAKERSADAHAEEYRRLADAGAPESDEDLPDDLDTPDGLDAFNEHISRENALMRRHLERESRTHQSISGMFSKPHPYPWQTAGSGPDSNRGWASIQGSPPNPH